MRSISMGTVIVAGALTLAGCVSMGPNYDPTTIEQLQPGMDKAAVIARLGRPTSVASLPDGKQQLMWIHSRGDMLGRAQARSVMLMFGADGKYIGLVSQAETNLR
jgi:hypothetical protein